MDKLRTKVAFYPWLVRITVENETAGEVPHAPHAHHQRSCWVEDKWFNICNLKNGPLWKKVVFWRPSFSRCCSNSGSTQCQSRWSLWIWLKTNLISGLHDFDHIYVDTYYIYIHVCNSRILEILSFGNFLLVVLFWCGKETHQPDCCGF